MKDYNEYEDNYDLYLSDNSIIHVAFAVTDPNGTYSCFVGTAMLSVIKNTEKQVCFHILHDDTLTEDNKRKLQQITQDTNCIVLFHLMDQSLSKIDLDNYWIKRYTIGSMFRLFLPELLPNLSKIIYLDADIMFLRDIDELWNIDVTDYCIAGVHDIGFERNVTPSPCIVSGEVKLERYINSGVLVMNLNNIRARGNMLELALKSIEKYPNTVLPDQDAINHVYADSILLLDAIWNCYAVYERQATKELREVVYHYMGQPFIDYSEPTEYDKYYLELQQMTPWGYKQAEKQLYHGLFVGFDKVNQLQKLLEKASNPFIKRIFYGPNTEAMKTVTKMVCIRECDYYIETDLGQRVEYRGTTPVKDFIELHKEDKEKVIVLVLPQASNGNAIRNLEQLGYKNGENFFVIPRLLVAKQGGYWG